MGLGLEAEVDRKMVMLSAELKGGL